MMYSEFIKGTGCKDNQKNYEIFKGFEQVYYNTDTTKEDIYKMAKKVCDYSKSEKEIEIENEINSEIARLKNEIERYKNELDFYKQNGFGCFNPDYYKNTIKEDKEKIQMLLYVLK